ncbi:MAG: hypothetical protein AVDCRST_MAG85-2648 [uncultured Solirubrobacteraceae bacterium]|uniref:Uncharacterized protein n=1 Tax=uncultured Solirubrobacteraceae bacterium TaxID=1162706 RepID=A0A6J4T817_9ACTN|nr:MAG: hypothetical protein AVDCRST_MAG85-2648 [uncultured Solirubrobacteraceae bacterium]
MRRLLAICAVDEPGGAEIGLHRLLRRLDWQITLTTPGGIDGTVALPVGGLERGSGARAVLSFPTVRRLARGADVVYLNGGVPARLLPALRGHRTVLHVHDMVTRVPPHWRAADVVLADSRAVADRLGALHSHVVGCPVEFDPPLVDPPWSPGDGPVVGFVGRIEPRKGPLTLVEAAPLIRAQRPGARVVLVGDDPYGSDPAHFAAVRRSSDVEHFGWLANAAGLMRHLDVLVVPSVEEPFGTVAAEAMAAGTPVVASAVGGLIDVVDDHVTGRLVPAGNAASLADAVLNVLDHREQMGEAARERASRWSADAYAEHVGAILERLASRGETRPRGDGGGAVS